MTVLDGAPRIGVSWVSPNEQRGNRYLDAVTRAGGLALPLPAGAGSWRSELRGIRGLLLTGGVDLDPPLYGEANAGLSIDVNRRRDDLEIAALRLCLDRGLPVLAICRGFQLVNVALGGSLIQDVQTVVEHRALAGQSSYHAIAIEKGSTLAAMASRLAGKVNSRHHQGVDALRAAPKLRVTALAPDGLVEGLELPGDQFLVAVQCHPERLREVPLLRGLFAALVMEARSA